MKKIISDLHIHSTHSDGTLSPLEIIDELKRLGGRFFSITDHDTCSAYTEIYSHLKDTDLKLIPGMEFSTLDDYNRNFRDIHIVGYFINIKNKELESYSNRVQTGRIEEKKIMVQHLNDEKFPVTWKDVEKRANGASVGKPHLVETTLDNMNLSGQQRYEMREKIYTLCHDLKVPRNGVMNIKDVISFIHNQGGLAILAHPELYNNHEDIIEESISCNIDGIELFNKYRYATTSNDFKFFLSEEQIKKYELLAHKNNLILTGGSDFHGMNTTSFLLSGGLNEEQTEKFISDCQNFKFIL